MTSDAEMKIYYAERAPYYDAVYAKPERQQDIAFLIHELTAKCQDRQVLEVACGTGFWTQHLGPKAASYVATDALAETLAFAQSRPGVQGLRFRQADAYDLPTDLGWFDTAFAGLWFSHVPIQQRLSFLRGLHQRLHPSAQVLLLDNNRVQCQELPIVETDAFGNTYQQRPLRDGSTHRVLKNFPDQVELRSLLDELDAEYTSYQMLDNFWLLQYRLSA